MLTDIEKTNDRQIEICSLISEAALHNLRSDMFDMGLTEVFILIRPERDWFRFSDPVRNAVMQSTMRWGKWS